MVDKIRVNTVSLTGTKNNVNSQLSSIIAQISSLNEDISRLDNMWDGEAHAAFHMAFLSDVRRLQEVCRNMQGIVAYEDTAIKEYDKCERQVSSLIDGIKI